MTSKTQSQLTGTLASEVDQAQLELEPKESGVRIDSKDEKLDWLSRRAVALESIPLRRSVRSSLWLNKLDSPRFPGGRSLLEIDVSRYV